jgi:hypothetical protein
VDVPRRTSRAQQRGQQVPGRRADAGRGQRAQGIAGEDHRRLPAAGSGEALRMLGVGRREHLGGLALLDAFAQQAGGAEGERHGSAAAILPQARDFGQRFAQAARRVHGDCLLRVGGGGRHECQQQGRERAHLNWPCRRWGRTAARRRSCSGDRLLARRGGHPVDELLRLRGLHVRELLRAHDHHAVLVEQAAVAFDQHRQVAPVPEAEPGAAVGQHVGVAGRADVQRRAHAAAALL